MVDDYLHALEERIPGIISELVPYTLSFTARITFMVINFFVALIVSIYFIATKEKFMAQLKKTLFAFMKKEKADRL